MNLAKTERLQLCDLLSERGPDSPTLCEGWTTHDLAAHLYVRENDLLGAPGIVVKPLEGLTERRMSDVKQKYSWDDLVGKLRKGPAKFSVLAIPGVDESANAVEFFIHHEDIRRAGDEPQGPRQLPDETADFLWRRLALLARVLFRKSEVGIVLERADGKNEPETIRARPGTRTVTIVGDPGELMLFAYGRKDSAQVRLIGDPDAVTVVLNTELSA